MGEIVHAAGFPDYSGDPASELEQIKNEYLGGNYMRESALFRLWRMWANKDYLRLTIPGTDEPIYPTWDDFVRSELYDIGVSRSTVYSRIRLYSVLQWLGYSDGYMLEMVRFRPHLLDKAINKMLSWDTRNGVPREVKLPDFDDPEEAAPFMRDVVDDVYTSDMAAEIIKSLDQDINGRPEVKITVEPDAGLIHVHFAEHSVDENGVILASPLVSVTFYSDADVPDWVWHELQRKYRL